MNIGELAERTGLSRSRIRFYESKGLISLVSRGENGYRSYQPDAVLALRIITSAQQAGFSLGEIARVLPSDLSGWQHGEMLALFRQKVADIGDMIGRLESSRRSLEALIEKMENKPADVGCDENARAILDAMERPRGL